MTDNIFTVLNKHPKLYELLRNPFWKIRINSYALAAGCNMWFVALETEGNIDVEYIRENITLDQVDVFLTDIEQIITETHEIMRASRQ